MSVLGSWSTTSFPRQLGVTRLRSRANDPSVPEGSEILSEWGGSTTKHFSIITGTLRTGKTRLFRFPWEQKPLQSGEAQFHLCFKTGDTGFVHGSCCTDDVIEEGGLADASLSSDDQNATHSVTCCIKKVYQLLPFHPAAHEHGPMLAELPIWTSPRVVPGGQSALIVCCDGLNGLPEAITGVWPLADVQTRVVHLVRNTPRYASRAQLAEDHDRPSQGVHRRHPGRRRAAL